jgi:hypothetical protein
MSISFGIVTMMSGLPIVQPSANSTGAGLSFPSPSIAPPSAHVVMVLISASLRNREFLK